MVKSLQKNVNTKVLAGHHWKLWCSQMSLKRCTTTAEIRWNKNEDRKSLDESTYVPASVEQISVYNNW